MITPSRLDAAEGGGNVDYIVVLGIGICAFCVYGIVNSINDKGIDAFWDGLYTKVIRGRNAVTARRVVFGRTARLERARLTLDPFALHQADLDGLDDFDHAWLHKVARSEIAQLGAALAAAHGDPDNPGRDRALACYDAAALLAAEREDRLDLLGAIVLAREGQTALAQRDPLPLPVCQVHPLHGVADRRLAKRRRFRLGKPRVMCASCGGCGTLERDKRALLVAGVPYYRTTGFWASVGFGALDPELPTRVLEYMGVE
jgi:hypothetical protein